MKGKGTRDTKKLRIFPFCIDFLLFIIYKYTSDVLRMKVLINLMVLKSSNGILVSVPPHFKLFNLSLVLSNNPDLSRDCIEKIYRIHTNSAPVYYFPVRHFGGSSNQIFSRGSFIGEGLVIWMIYFFK